MTFSYLYAIIIVMDNQAVNKNSTTQPSPMKWVVIMVVIVIALILIYYFAFAKNKAANTTSNNNTNTTTTVTTTTTATGTTTPTPSSSSSTNNVYQTKTSNGKTYLANTQGMTLYTYSADSNGVSNCTGECASAWPPYTATSQSNLPANITVITRSDGSKQYAYKGKPLYTFTSDSNPGDVTGDGVNGFNLATP